MSAPIKDVKIKPSIVERQAIAKRLASRYADVLARLSTK